MSNNIKNMPVFRGRFGTRSKRKKTNPKWDKWRYPRGIDISWRRGDNQMPKAGFGGDKKTKNLHPTKRTEVYINNFSQLEKYVKEHKDLNKVIFRFAANIGLKKILIIKEFVEKHKLKVINLNEKKLVPKIKNEKIEQNSSLKKEQKTEQKKDEVKK